MLFKKLNKFNDTYVQISSINIFRILLNKINTPKFLDLVYRESLLLFSMKLIYKFLKPISHSVYYIFLI